MRSLPMQALTAQQKKLDDQFLFLKSSFCLPTYPSCTILHQSLSNPVTRIHGLVFCTHCVLHFI
uniref:Uncharacterized protein n=1 Tax=Anguilla anguilla TaxID=7936 RepID=A0A0E9XFA6_ANGAN